MYLMKRILLLGLAVLFGSIVIRADITVAADGTGDVRTVQAAVDKVPEGNTKRVKIRIKPGTYTEQVRVPADKPYISFIADTADKRIISLSPTATPIRRVPWSIPSTRLTAPPP